LSLFIVKELTFLLFFKYLHAFTVLLSFALFAWRWRLLARNKARPGFLRWLPHLNDTVLLVSGAITAYLWSWNPLQQPWLLGKILLLLLYIYFGAKTLHHSHANGSEKRWGLAAILVYLLIIGLAVAKPGMAG
jgi:uncharacterized membrane protein SirB2